MNVSALIALSCVAITATAAEAPRRIAVLVGANQAPPGLETLRYAHRDALSVREALIDVGDFAPGDVHVLLDPAPDAVLRTLDAVAASVRESPAETLVLFYYSGHADDTALYPGGQPLRLEALKARIEATGATLRIGILDACRGGAWTRAKGLRPAVPFEVSVPLGLVSEGSALLASSSGFEDAHEAEALQGSFFTHYLVAGMRGAASRPASGQVTLSDAFAYADQMTIRDTAAHSAQPQHPSFELKLHGRQDVVLARVSASPTVLVLAEEQGPLQLVQLSTGIVVLEVAPGQQTWTLAVPPGDYLLRRTAVGGNFTREVTVAPGVPAHVDEADLELVAAPGLAKGSAVTAQARRHELSIGANGLPFDEFTRGLGPELRYALHLNRVLGVSLRFSYAAQFDSGLKQQMLKQFGILPTNFPAEQWSVALEGTVAPWSGVRLGDSRLWGELSTGVGSVGFSGTSPQEALKPSLNVEGALYLGLGWDLAVRLSLRDELLPTQQFQSIFSAQLGVSYALGAAL